MLKLFKYENYSVVISEEALLLKPFKEIWDRDKSEDKSVALLELGYIYFLVDPRSDYQHYIDDDERALAIKEGEGLPKKWSPDKKVKEAIEFYKTFTPLSYKVLEDTKAMVDKLRHFLRDIDLTQVDDKGKPVYTINSITSTIKLIPSLIKELNEAEKAIAREEITVGKIRGQGEKTLMEDGIIL